MGTVGRIIVLCSCVCVLVVMLNTRKSSLHIPVQIHLFISTDGKVVHCSSCLLSLKTGVVGRRSSAGEEMLMFWVTVEYFLGGWEMGGALFQGLSYSS